MHLKSTALFSALLLTVAGCSHERETDYAHLKSLQDYRVPLDSQPFAAGVPKRAMFIFPHADDEVAHAGTIAYLKSLGAEVKLYTLTQDNDPAKKPVRAAELRCAVKALSIDAFKQGDFYNNSWDDVLKDSVSFWPDHLPAIEAAISREIDSFRPSSIYLYDTLIGGYGHPEHLLTSKATFRALRKLPAPAAGGVRRVYRSTLPERLDTTLLGELPTYWMYRDKNHGQGKPAPTLAYDITRFWPAKAAAARCHASQEHVMRKFYLKPEGNDSLHFHTFDREYYVVTNR